MATVLSATHSSEWTRPQARAAAKLILKTFPEGVNKSLIGEVGCGRGLRLAALPADYRFGLDSPAITKAMLADKTIDYRPVDLEQSFTGPGLDLVLCVDLAHHLSPARAASLISDLCDLAPAVIFAAATPDHPGAFANPQHPDYWHALFATRHYRPLDCLRPAISKRSSLPPIFQSTATLYLSHHITL